MLQPYTVPELSDGVVRLRRHTDDDIDALVEMCNDPLFVAYTSVPVPYERQHARRWVREIVPGGWERGDARGWAIEAVGDDGVPRLAGNIDIRGARLADIGYGLHPWARGRGIIARATRLATRWCFDNSGVQVVHWRSHVGNVASRRAAWAAGFTFHDTVPRLLEERDRLFDAWTAALLPDDAPTPRTTWLSPVELAGDGIRLRAFGADDTDRIVEACSDPRTMHWLDSLPRPYTAADAGAYLLRRIELASLGKSVSWAVADRDTDRLLGSLTLMRFFDEQAEVGYWTHPQARGSGVMSRAVRLACAPAFAPVGEGGYGRRRLQLRAAAGNAASRHVAVRAGFAEVGHQRDACRLGDGSVTDQVLYELLPADVSR